MNLSHLLLFKQKAYKDIGDYAFDNCTSLTAVTIGNSVTTIGNFAFAYCTSLTAVTIPVSVRTIGDYALVPN